MRKLLLSLILIFSYTQLAYADLETHQAATVVIGQPDFFDSANRATRRGMSSPVSVVVGGGKLIVCDSVFNRVLIFNKIPTENFAPADVVVGQPDFNTTAGFVTSQQNLWLPTDVSTDGTRLFIADQRNSRVLIYNQIPTVNFAPADIVLGQVDFNTRASQTTQRGFTRASRVHFDGKRLLVSDRNNARVLIYNTLPAENFAPADVVIGQQDFISSADNRTAQKLGDEGVGIHSSGKQLFLADNSNARVMVFNEFPTKNFTAADIVLGQESFTIRELIVSRRGRNEGSRVYTDGIRLFITDTNNNRVLYYKKIPKENYASPDIVIGQENFSQNVGRTTNQGLIAPGGAYFDGQRLFIADSGNSRVLIYRATDDNFKDLGPQFSQGKAVVGKVFWDFDGDGRQN